ncbi:plastocyanin [Saliphagus sp. LR7]|uniref:cupredoxin domain-containing protein n=1 Tax=Saliphagus sp. LR7 TaxID=2282654 RepID=UPI0018E57F40|nr:plastocyanin [Saliphagus sp. LR7]
MTPTNNGSGDDDRYNANVTRDALPIGRRGVLSAVGAGTMLAGFGTGVGAADEHGDTLPTAEVSGGEVHPVFGFAALSGEIEPPLTPDHEVQALIRPREDREIPEFFFEPTGLAVEPGDTVRFSLVTPHHSVTAFHPAMGFAPRVPENVPPFSSPVLPVNAYWLYTFAEEGVYDFHCGPHEMFGHVGRIVAGSATGPGAEPVPGPESESTGGGGEDESETTGPELRSPTGTAASVLNDRSLQPECILRNGTVSWEKIDDENKQLVL